MRKAVLSLLVENSSGVLSRVSGLFSRRGYNIESLTVGETLDPNYSRMTIVASGDEDVLDQIEKQLGKLIDIKEIKELPISETVCRELILVKVACDAAQRSEIASLSSIFHAKVLDVAENSVVIELTGNQSKLNAFVSLLNSYHIIEIARTGITALERGTETVQ